MYNGWRKASFSNPSGNCVETANFRKASHSIHDNCVEAGGFRKASHSASSYYVEAATGVAVRDTKASGTGPTLEFSAGNWARFTSIIKAI